MLVNIITPILPEATPVAITLKTKGTGPNLPVYGVILKLACLACQSCQGNNATASLSQEKQLSVHLKHSVLIAHNKWVLFPSNGSRISKPKKIFSASAFIPSLHDPATSPCHHHKLISCYHE